MIVDGLPSVDGLGESSQLAAVRALDWTWIGLARKGEVPYGVWGILDSSGGGIEIFLWLDLGSVPRLELDGRAPTGSIPCKFTECMR